MKTIKLNRKLKVTIATFIRGKKVRDIARNTRQIRIQTDKLINKSLNGEEKLWN